MAGIPPWPEVTSWSEVLPADPALPPRSFSLCSHLSRSWTTRSHFPVYSLFHSGPTLQGGALWSRQHVLPWVQKQRARCQEGLKEPVTKAPWWCRWFRRVTLPVGPPTPGPSGCTPDMLCSAEQNRKQNQKEDLSSPPCGSICRAAPGRGRPCQEGAEGRLSGTSSSSPSRRQALGSSGAVCTCNTAYPSLPSSPWPPVLKRSRSK